MKNVSQHTELCGIKITKLRDPVTLLVCYRPPDVGNLSNKEWDAILSNTASCGNSVLMGDLNCHHKTWNCRSTDANGIKLLKSAEKYNLYLHNYDNTTYTDSRTGNKNNLDLIFSTTNIAPHISTCVLDDTMGSDLNPVSVTLDMERFIYMRKSFKLQSKRTRWTDFNSFLLAEYESFLNLEFDMMTAVEKYEFFTGVVSSAVMNSTLRRKNVSAKRHKNPVSWWDIDCYRIKRLRQAAYKNRSFLRRNLIFFCTKK